MGVAAASSLVSWLTTRSLDARTSTRPWNARATADEPSALVPPRSWCRLLRNHVRKSRGSACTVDVNRFVDAVEMACSSSCGLTWPLNRRGLQSLRTSSPNEWTGNSLYGGIGRTQPGVRGKDGGGARPDGRTEGRAGRGVVGFAHEKVAEGGDVGEGLRHHVDVVVGLDVVQTDEA